MSHENVELVQRGFDHLLATGEPDWETLDEDVEVRDHDIMDGREYRGHADVRRWLFEDWSDAWSVWTAQPEEYIDAGGDRVIAVFRISATGRSSGVRIERQDAIVYVLRDLRIVRIDYYNSRQQALDAVGLAD
jgi:ketosteroid isomerase-like protein